MTRLARLALALAWALAAAGLAAQGPQLVVQTGHFGAVAALALSPDSRLLASAGFDNTILLWSTETGSQLRALKAHTRPVTSVALGADGRVLASGSADGTARLWDPATGELRRTLEVHSAVDALALSPDAALLATASFDNNIRLWRVSDGREGREVCTLRGHTGGVAAVAFAPDGKTLASGSHDHGVRLWDVGTCRLVRPFEGHQAAVTSVAFSPDGRRIASGGGGYSGRAQVIVWDVASGRGQEFRSADEWVSSLAFSPDGRSLVAGTRSPGQALRVWELESGKDVTLPTRANVVMAVVFSRDGRLFASAGDDNAVTLHDPATWRERPGLQGHVEPVTALASSADRRFLAAAGRSGDIKVWDVAQRQNFRRLAGHGAQVSALAFSSRGELASAGYDRTVRLWSLAGGGPPRTLPSPAVVRCLAFSPDGGLLAGGAQDDAVRLWSAATGEPAGSLPGHVDYVSAVAFSPDGTRLASASADTVRLWNVATRELLESFQAHRSAVLALAFSPDGRWLASAGADHEIKLWHAGTRGLLRTLKGHAGPVTSLVFLSGGRRLASASADHSVKVWDLDAPGEPRTLEGHTDVVTALAASPTEPADGAAGAGSLLWSSGTDARTVLWDASGGRPLASLTALDQADWAVVDPEGRFDASAGGMKLVHWVLGTEPIALEQAKARFWDVGLLAKLAGFEPEPLLAVGAFSEVKLFPTVSYGPMSADGRSVNVTLTDRGGGIGRVEVRLNGKELLDDARGGSTDPGAGQVTLALAVPPELLVRGEVNTLSVVPSNAEGTLASPGVVLAFVPSGPRSSEPIELYAVVAGISDYASRAMHLQYAAQDAERFAQALRIAGNRLFRPENVHVRLLATPAYAPAAWEPTKANFTRAFDEVRRARPTDIVVVYLSGHGVAREERGRQLYVYPTQEAGGTHTDRFADPGQRAREALTSDELIGWMTGPAGIRPLKQVLILDTCAAGAVVGELWQARGTAGAAVRALDRMKDRTGFHILMGSAADQLSREANRYGSGLLTYALLQAMRGARLRDDRFVDVRALFDYAQEEVPRLAHEVGTTQKPQIAAGPGDSFDIGALEPEDKDAIPVPRLKHVVVRPSLEGSPCCGDPLKLEAALHQRLAELAFERGPGPEGRSLINYVPVAELPGAVEIHGIYERKAGAVHVELALIRDGHALDPPLTFDGTDRNVEALADEMTTAIAAAIGSLGEPGAPPP